MRQLPSHIFSATALWLATTASGAQLTVGGGSTVRLGDGGLDLGCADLVVAGTMAAGTSGIDQTRDVGIAPSGTVEGESATLNVTGDWDNAGSFNAGTAIVNFVGGCGRNSAIISGETTFSTLWITTSTGKLYSFQSGSTQTITNSLTLTGVAGNLLTLRSTVGGNEAFLDLQGNHSTDFVDVDDVHAIGNTITLGPGSVQGDNTVGWIGVAVPALSVVALVLLMLTIIAAGHRSLRVRQGAARIV